MKISSFTSNSKILTELGERLKTARIRAGFTQKSLSESSGVAKSTIERAEKGESIQVLNLIKILRTLNMLSALDSLLPDTAPSPMEYLISEKQVSYGKRKRASKKRSAAENSPFIWGEDK